MITITPMKAVLFYGDFLLKNDIVKIIVDMNKNTFNLWNIKIMK
ncbi:hypothetical protein XSR1_60010 [Xenorhabdus szentirmaii DSM 16338]|uniref:Uncharacterized protein n=1 Tax=Xenorhabdus szentirmaii DSM 16338 TaxID=1427518 RepID=W1J549_9GAMM|nr:hypothetical protein XSR1_60010 [Xenorhabdus szentirmaii DSM 16338]